ncbi:MAG: AAA family ATPase [Cyanobacteria bacterium P01_F01_bin.53]
MNVDIPISPPITAAAGPETGPNQPLETASVLSLIVLRVRLRSQRRIAWLNHLWGAPGHHETRSQHSFESYLQVCLDDRDRPVDEAQWYQTEETVQILNERIQRVERSLAGPAGEKLRRLAEMFLLTEPELDVLQCCVAVAMDPTLAPVCGYLQQHSARTYATNALVARLFDYGHRSLWSPSSALAIWGLVSAGDAALGEPVPLAVDAIVVDWFQGELHLDADLIESVKTVKVHPPLASWPVADTAIAIEQLMQHHPAVRVIITGAPASGRRTFAAAVAARFGIELLSVDTGLIAEETWPDRFIKIQRLALMGGMGVVWFGPGVHRSWPSQIALAPLQFVVCDEGQGILAGDHTSSAQSVRAVDYRLTLPALTLAERRQLWQAAIPETAVWPAADLEALVSRYQLTVGDISTIGSREPASAHEAADFSRELTRQRLGPLGQLLDCPFHWADLVLGDKARQELEDFAFEAQERAAFWELPQAQRLFPRGTGLVALFSGPSGTGKTMAAQVLAADLSLDLFRIDLAMVVSKYIGETAKQLKQIFTRASRMNAVLFFDEADSLFSKRTEVKDSHDRHANADTSYLLQLLEDYRGIVILATNKKQNIDPAFTRRVRYVLDFPRPDKGQRQQIWTRVMGELCGEEVGRQVEGAIATLAEGVELSGAQIKNAVLSAIFVSRRLREPVNISHLLRGVDRELGKEGRSIGSREKARLVNHG